MWFWLLLVLFLVLFVAQMLVVAALALRGTFHDHAQLRDRYLRPGVAAPAAGRPRIIMTYWKPPPSHVTAMLSTYAPEFDLEFFDDDRCRTFLATHFVDAVLFKYDALTRRKQHQHAADLMRCCALAVFPGKNLYLDIKTVLVAPVSAWFSLDGNQQEIVTVRSPFSFVHIGILGGPSTWKGWLTMVSLLTTTPLCVSKLYYHTHCAQFYFRVADDRVKYLQEHCGDAQCETTVRRDHYGLCCVISDTEGRVVMHSRHAAYPF